MTLTLTYRDADMQTNAYVAQTPTDDDHTDDVFVEGGRPSIAQYAAPYCEGSGNTEVT